MIGSGTDYGIVYRHIDIRNVFSGVFVLHIANHIGISFLLAKSIDATKQHHEYSE